MTDSGVGPAEHRAGAYVQQPQGFRAFIPSAFPPEDLQLTSLLGVLSEADLALGRLAGSTAVVPSPDLFVFMYVRREAVLSSQIEGTQASLMDILEWEASEKAGRGKLDIQEVSNYLAALNLGLERAATLPMSLRLIREVHARLMQGVRGGGPAKTPGEFRRSQNWVGGPSPGEAQYVPPPVAELDRTLAEFERFLHAGDSLPVLVRIALAHAQFETIHPFLDGNGRVGRLLVSFLLHQYGILDRPLLYLSIFFKQHRAEYYRRLQAIRDEGAWEPWIAFFLRGVATVAEEAATTVQSILDLRGRLQTDLSAGMGQRGGQAIRLLDSLFENPMVTVKTVQRRLDISQPTANALVNDLERLGVLEETTGKRRNRIFVLEGYMRLFEEREART